MGTGSAVVILVSCCIDLSNSPLHQIISNVTMVGGKDRPILKLRDMEEKHLHNLFLKNMSGLIEEVKNPSPRLNPNSACGGMATHAGLALELGITRKKSLSPQMEAILIWCQCRTRGLQNVQRAVTRRRKASNIHSKPQMISRYKKLAEQTTVYNSSKGIRTYTDVYR